MSFLVSTVLIPCYQIKILCFLKSGRKQSNPGTASNCQILIALTLLITCNTSPSQMKRQCTKSLMMSKSDWNKCIWIRYKTISVGLQCCISIGVAQALTSLSPNDNLVLWQGAVHNFSEVYALCSSLTSPHPFHTKSDSKASSDMTTYNSKFKICILCTPFWLHRSIMICKSRPRGQIWPARSFGWPTRSFPWRTLWQLHLVEKMLFILIQYNAWVSKCACPPTWFTKHIYIIQGLD